MGIILISFPFKVKRYTKKYMNKKCWDGWIFTNEHIWVTKLHQDQKRTLLPPPTPQKSTLPCDNNYPDI